MNLRAWMLALTLCFGIVGLADAGKPKTRLEASQLVTGEIRIDAQGVVSGYTFDKADKLAEGVRTYLDSVVPKLRFEPVLRDGQPVAARSNMSLRLVLRHREGDAEHYEMTVKGMHFGMGQEPEGTVIKSLKLTPPRYPDAALRQGGGAEVYLLVKVGRDGKVQEAMAEQVNLLSYGNPGDADLLRRQFEESAIKQALKRWSFQPPTIGDEADDPYWTVRVPVVYSMGNERITKGGWKVYDPGPQRQAPWPTEPLPMGFSPDALPGGGAHVAGRGLRLLADPRG
jgi:hypothetical protein